MSVLDAVMYRHSVIRKIPQIIEAFYDDSVDYRGANIFSKRMRYILMNIHHNSNRSPG